ncbi:MAG: hypothetical protein Kow00114_37110 [Kiloniellaceae bacterium]
MSRLPKGLLANFSRDDLARDYAKQLYDYWHDARGAAAIPPIDALDPTRLPRACLPYLSVLEVETRPFRLRSRLAGTALVEQLGSDPTGQYLDETPGMAAQIARMAWCVQEQRPYLTNDDVTFAPNKHKRYQVLILPFGDSERGVERVVGVFCFLEGFGPPRNWSV